MKSLLQQIAAGKQSFAPTNDDYIDFQPIAQKLKEAYYLGYIDFYKPHHESETGKNYADLVMATGLTPAGRKFLEA